MDIPLMTPHLVWRPRTFWPLTTTVFSEPMTAKGMRSWFTSAMLHVCSFYSKAFLDLVLVSDFVLVVLLVLVGVHAQVVELELLLYPLLERGALLEGQAV